jgi:hypothetical protein
MPDCRSIRAGAAIAFAGFIAAAVAGSDAAHAQVVAAGFKAGVSSSSISSNQLGPVPESLVAATGGAFVRVGFGNFAIQPEALLATRGARYSPSQGVTRYEVTYLEVPVLLVGLLPFGAGSHVFAGPAFAFETGCTITARAQGADGDYDCDDPVFPEERRTHDISGVFGGGIAIPVGPGGVLVELRYTHGFVNTVASPADATAYNRSAALLVSYMIGLRNR